ncbi:hypothetical protein BJ170DRAFT_683210 [Xylariales sp. AK1849]|nr:hypothetical protein BJ170DRAFT_683210 [Xylariales sp. AK1849]
MALEDNLHEEVINDYSCYIYIRNTSDHDLTLADCGIKDGEWPKGRPLNTIESKSEGMLHLKDNRGYGGTEGWVRYDSCVDDKKESFTLKFCDPQWPGSENWLLGSSTQPKILSVSVKESSKEGRPLTGNVDIHVTDPRAGNAITNACLAADDIDPRDHSFHPSFDIGFEFPLDKLFGKKYPVHENIAIAAFIRSKLSKVCESPWPSSTTYNNLNDKQWEYIRGLLWNDDPSCYLLTDDENQNHLFSNGFKWLWDFERGDPTCMIQRSHYGNLQFLHAMAAEKGELPEVTRVKLVKWLEVMYKLACGNQGISEGTRLRECLPTDFTNSTVPSGEHTLRQLLLSHTPSYRKTNVQLRALGSCLHVIQDSYAIGHTQRRLQNPLDLIGRDEKGFIRFKAGTYGIWGPILVFHTYKGQDSSRHRHYDGLENVPLPIPNILTSYNDIVGARSAIDACVEFLNLFAEKAPWDDVQNYLETSVFELDPHAKRSDSLVDEPDNSSSSNYSYTDADCDLEYKAGWQRKLERLEARVPTAHGRTPTSNRRSLWRHAIVGLAASLSLLSAATLIYFNLKV